MKKMDQTICRFVLFLSLFSIAFSDPGTSIVQFDSKNAENYFAPMGTLLGTCMNSGYYRKASPHKIFGFDITVDVAYAMFPSVKTTYDFVIPDESLSYTYQFQFLKSDLKISGKNALLEHIPDANTDTIYTNDLFIDMPISFDLPLDKLFNDPESTPNIIGNSTLVDLQFDFSVAGDELTNQIVDGIWLRAQDINGIGNDYYVYNKENGFLIHKIAAIDSASFRNYLYEDQDINNTLKSSLEAMNISLPIPGGFGHLFQELPISGGLPLPIIQASIGLPYHTEITIRGLPEMPISSMGTIQLGGFGGKIGISEYINDIYYDNRSSIKYEFDNPNFSYSNIINFIEAKPADIDSLDLEKVISNFRIYNINIQELDSLSYGFAEGDTSTVNEIQKKIKGTLMQLLSMPELHKKTETEKFPFDLALGYYTSVSTLNMGGPMINSINHMISMQAGKIFNTPSISFLGGIGIFGGIGFEFSKLNLNYEYTNLFGDPIDVSLNLSGSNLFRSNIGARMRILFFDAYLDYNIGASNTINAGFGITFN